jgi:hypothetical protein
MCAQRDIEVRSYNHCYSGKEIYITNSECIFVALVIQHSSRLRRIVICRLPALQHFSTLSHGFQGRDIE